MLKKGFTLTEVLITLGVIGILAAITIPRLFNNTQNAHLGAQYANAISALETGAGMYLYDKGVKNTDYILNASNKAWMKPSDMLAALANGYVKMTSANKPGGTLKSGDGTVSITTCYSMPDKSLVCTTGTATDKILTKNSDDAAGKWKPAESEIVFISSKSIKQKNLVEGYDFFRLSMSAEGLLFIPGLDYDTSAGCDLDKGGKGCAGKVAQNGWKVKYD